MNPIKPHADEEKLRLCTAAPTGDPFAMSIK